VKAVAALLCIGAFIVFMLAVLFLHKGPPAEGCRCQHCVCPPVR
jgi:hypothetical protein